MMLNGSIRAVAISAVFVVAYSPGMLVADQPVGEWLRSSGKDLQICLKGEVLDADGRAATDVKITGSLNTPGGNQPIELDVDGHRFEVWIPVNKVQWYSMSLKAASRTDEQVAYKQLSSYELRQAAITGIKLKLQPTTRRVLVKVMYEGRPVSGAQVSVVAGRVEIRARSGAEGIARFGLLPEQQLYSLSAWTDDFRIGGYTFSRKPHRDPNADEHVVELSKCRDQKLRFVDEAGSPVSGFNGEMHMATPAPDFNYIGSGEFSRVSTDAAGEFIYRWFPDWEKHYFYVEANSKRWVMDGEKEFVDGAVVFKLKKSVGRKQVRGSVVSTSTDVGGFLVSLRSFQGERDNHADFVDTFADADGQFSVDVLPDATYCAYVLDSRWVGGIVDLIPYQSATDQITPPKLSVVEGQEVEVIVTSGPQKKPYQNLGLNFRREYKYTWREEGKTRHGSSGPQWWGTTDAAGRVTVRTLPGTFKASVHTPFWQAEETVEVRNGEVAKIRLHREVEKKQRVSGRVVLSEVVASSVEGAEISLGSVDGNYDDQLKSAPDGSFSFETYSTEIGLFGYSRDGRAAGVMIVKDLNAPITLQLHPTVEYCGQLLGEGDRPLANHEVRAHVHVDRDSDSGTILPWGFDAKTIRAKTDEQGHYSLQGLPTHTKVYVRTASIESPTENVYLDEIFLEANESRPRTVSRLAKSSSNVSEKPLAARYETTLRDCALCGFHLMMIVSNENRNVKDFVNAHFVDYENNDDVSTFMQIVFSRQPGKLTSADAEFLNKRNWQVPGENRVLACAVDSKGNELGRIEIDVTDAASIEKAAQFQHQFAPPPADAEKKWQDAFAEATRTNKRVWARVSQRYCGPCFRLARWLDDQRLLLEKDYVLLKIDDVRDLNGIRVAKRLTQGKHHGVPFHAIFDPRGMLLVDSAGPLGNVGYPSGFEGKKQLRKMLLATRQNLTDAEVEKIVDSLED